MKNKKKKGKLKIFIKLMLFLLVLFIIIGFSYYFAVTNNSKLVLSKLPTAYKDIQIFDRLNNDITPLYYSNFVNSNEIPNNIKLAFLTTEDREFYTHKGINYKRIAGAMVNNLKSGNLTEGGSTITQQLVKNTHLNQDKNFNRKLKEYKIAKQLEHNFSKDEILSMYLNILYFGNGIYGIKNASKVFFDKNIDELNLAEASMLAGIVKNPSKYSPLVNYDNSCKRKDLILQLLYKTNKIDNKELLNLLDYRIDIKNIKENKNNINSYCNNAIFETKQILGLKQNEKLPKNIKIYTNLDLQVQEIVDDIVTNKKATICNENGKYPDNAIIVLDNKNYGVIGFSSSYKQSLFNINRQIGSLAKPFVSYLPALENKLINIATPILDEPININGYSPNNYNGVYHGYTNMKESLAYSYNIPAVKILNELGIEKSKEFIKRINFNVTDIDGLSMALGGFTLGDNILNVAGAYAMLANNGIYNKPSFINKIIIDNSVLYNNYSKNKVASSGNSYIITNCLMDTVKEGTLKKMAYLPYQIAGKTGTVASTVGNSDSYSASYTTLNTVVSWQGNLSNNLDSMLSSKNTGGSYPTNQCYLVYEKMYKEIMPTDFSVPSDVIEEYIDKYSLENDHIVVRANPLFPKYLTKKEIFTLDNLPNEHSTLFDKINDYVVEIEEIYDGYKLKFSGYNFLYYEIYKTGIFSDTFITTIKKDNDLLEFVDISNNKIIKYNYIIKPYFMYNDKTKIYIKEKFIMVR